MRNSLHKALKRKNLDSERCLVEPDDTVDPPDEEDISTAPDQPVGKNKDLYLDTESSPEKRNKKFLIYCKTTIIHRKSEIF